MNKKYPDRKIGIVTFNHEVNVIGDGMKESITINGDDLKDYNKLLENGNRCSQS
jgi:hypothetical protein